MERRHLDWEGTWNARDLGGLGTTTGLATRFGAVVRSESLSRLGAAGWSSLLDYGVTTILDLRNSDQRAAEPQSPPASLRTELAPLEQGLFEDPEFAEWGRAGWLGTPLYYPRFVERWPDRCADAVRAIAVAPPGGVVVHCGKGCDRTGLIVMLVLSVLGVSDEVIAGDHELTASRLSSARASDLGFEDQNPEIEELLRREGTSLRAANLAFLDALDAEATLRAGGLEPGHLDGLRRRLLPLP